MFKREKIFRSAWSLLIVIHIASSCTLQHEKQNTDTASPEATDRSYAYGICVDSLNVQRYAIQKNDNLASILSDLGFNGTDTEQITRAISPLYPPSKLQIGNIYATIATPDSTLAIQYLVFESSKTDYVVVDLRGDSLHVWDSSKAVTLRRRYSEATITSSLWNAIIESGGTPMLVLKLSDIYAWQIDFFDVKEGDSFRLMYDEAWVDDTTFVAISSIEGALFTHRGKEYRAIPFEQDSVREYFDEEGNSLRKAFLKAPLDFFRISSRFSNARFHPVLKRYRPHHGVDYAAPTGTPVKTIGDGVVIEKAYQRGGAGNYIKIRHNSTYATTYMHLSRFAKGIQKGSSVKQGEVIGYVGATGLATGPHLDFRVYKHNQPINPLTMEAPPSLPVKPELMDSFRLVHDRVLQEMDNLRIAESFLAEKETNNE
ncbi:MAG: Metalloendopeptidase-like membrane protein [Proteiniphilum acetatigenes]|jgi:murein DD-endopeptidase MepM/ murein hydrolase activator NlpD|uniref:Metalloendopeptidase-like membrane protein n=1 Tax=Proteiniphilum acetatigenes TaxID=294710 RepID=A0A117M0Q2_9BACT|nr:MAG: Metalloendopeptidase-like membrane protein [Proteiniphilum acetatigenes]